MDERLQEFVSSRNVEMRVDRQSGVIRGVKLLGLASRNGRRYLPAALAQAVSLYEDAKVNVNHPKGNPLASRDYQDRLGSIRKVRVREGEGLFGDLHFNPKHGLAEQLLWDATHAPENVGFSHNVQARTSRQGNHTVVEAILQVQSVDLVADPATTRGLYESSAADGGESGTLTDEALASLTLDQLRSARPDLVEAIEAAAAARLSRLESEIDSLRARNAAHQRRDTALRLLAEFELPESVKSDATGGAIVSQSFFESLLAAPDEQVMRSLVEERANLIAAARKLDGTGRGGRPTSREQNRFDATAGTLDARAFARAIS